MPTNQEYLEKKDVCKKKTEGVARVYDLDQKLPFYSSENLRKCA